MLNQMYSLLEQKNKIWKKYHSFSLTGYQQGRQVTRQHHDTEDCGFERGRVVLNQRAVLDQRNNMDPLSEGTFTLKWA